MAPSDAISGRFLYVRRFRGLCPISDVLGPTYEPAKPYTHQSQNRLSILPAEIRLQVFTDVVRNDPTELPMLNLDINEYTENCVKTIQKGTLKRYHGIARWLYLSEGTHPELLQEFYEAAFGRLNFILDLGYDDYVRTAAQFATLVPYLRACLPMVTRHIKVVNITLANSAAPQLNNGRLVRIKANFLVDLPKDARNYTITDVRSIDRRQIDSLRKGQHASDLIPKDWGRVLDAKNHLIECWMRQIEAAVRTATEEGLPYNPGDIALRSTASLRWFSFVQKLHWDRDETYQLPEAGESGSSEVLIEQLCTFCEDMETKGECRFTASNDHIAVRHVSEDQILERMGRLGRVIWGHNE